MGAPLEKPHGHGDHQARGEIRIEIGGRLPLAFCRLDEARQSGVNISVDRVAERGDRAIAARLRPNLEDHLHLLARLAEKVPAQALRHRGNHAVGFGEGRKGAGAIGLLARAQLLDDRLLRREVAIEIAGAHRRLGGDMLHGRGVKAVSHEGALGGLDDAPASIGVAHRLGRMAARKAPWRTCLENERSFSFLSLDYGGERRCTLMDAPRPEPSRRSGRESSGGARRCDSNRHWLTAGTTPAQADELRACLNRPPTLPSPPRLSSRGEGDERWSIFLKTEPLNCTFSPPRDGMLLHP